MSEKNLKVVSAPESKTSPGAASQAPAKSGLMARIGTGRLRMFLLVVLPTIAVLIGLTIYLLGGRYISTDNAFIGAQKVLITPDISGKIEKVVVREGQQVKEGDVLFEIDPRPFQAVLDQAKGQLAQAKAQLDLANINVNRDTPMAKLHAIPQSQLDTDTQTKASAEATVQATAANVEQAELNVGFTKVLSLIDGVAGLAQTQIGNLVATTTVLTSVSQVDPIKVYFPISEQEYL
ncbi:MAG: efflux RND transporter periplasmic adaptor subunit, partial [Pseudolabrys sp.]